MFGATDLIVYLWLFPVTLFIIIPLTMLCAWSMFQMVMPRKGSKHTAEKRTKQAFKGGIFSAARA